MLNSILALTANAVEAAGPDPFAGWTAILPAGTLVLGGLVVMLVNLYMRHSEDQDLALFFCALGGSLLSLITCVQQLAQPSGLAYAGALRGDGFSAYLGIVIALATAITVLISYTYHKRLKTNLGDYLTLVLFSASGMMLLGYANELVTIFVGVELMSIPIYILVGIERGSMRSIEASVKYLVLGAFASAFLLLGLTLMYGLFSVTANQLHLPATTVLTSLAPLAQNIDWHGHMPLVILALGMTMIGFAFKVGAVPFHQWVPDVYEGAPTALTGFMATAVKAAGFGVFLRILLVCFPVAGGPLGVQFVPSNETAVVKEVAPHGSAAKAVLQKDSTTPSPIQPGDVVKAVRAPGFDTKNVSTPTSFYQAVAGFNPGQKVQVMLERNGQTQTVETTAALSLGPFVGTILWIICIATIILGNLWALSQDNIKRMLAYSSIAHTGYLLLGVIAVTGAKQPGAGWEILFYLLTYMLMNLGAFAVVILAGRDDKDYEMISDLQGLAHRRPFLGLAMAIAMLSLAGIPLTGGFWGKVGIFYTAIQNGYTWLAIIAILGSLIGVYYYLRVVYMVFMRSPKSADEFPPTPERWSIHFGVAVTACGTMLIGLFPWPFMNFAMKAVQTLTG